MSVAAQSPQSPPKSVAVFSDFGSLLSFCSAALTRKEYLPETVRYVAGKSGDIAVELESHHAAAVRRFSEGVDRPISFLEKLPQGSDVATTQHMLGYLQPVDPDSFRHRGRRRQDIKYLLGARTPAEAQRIYDVLNHARSRDVQVRPLMAAPRGEEHAANHVLFSVTGGPPPRAAMDCAGRTWWGPAVRLPHGVEVYTQFPFVFDFPYEHLGRILWKPDPGIVLVGVDAPQILSIDIPQGCRSFEEVIAFGRTETNEAKSLSAQIAGSPATQLSIHLSLAPGRRRKSDTERIEQLGREIEAKTKAREMLLRRSEEAARPRPLAFEPLYLYRTEKNEIPPEIAQLLVEWCDERELQTLRYLKVNAAEFYDRKDDDSGYELHLLTVDTALSGQVVRDARHVWLSDYRPGRGETLRLIDDWARLRLRMFIPDDDSRLELYPEFTPGPEAARRIASGLAGKLSGPTDKTCFLLLPNAQGDMHVRRVEAGEFRPLVDAVKWDCAVDVEHLVKRVAHRQSREVRHDLVEQFRDNLTICGSKIADVVRSICVGADLQLRYEDRALNEVTAVVARAREVRKQLELLLPTLVNEAARAIDHAQPLLERIKSIRKLLDEIEQYGVQLPTSS